MKSNKIGALTTEYAKLYAKEQLVKKLRDAMSIKIREELELMGEKTYENTIGAFTTYDVLTYKFSKKVAIMEDKIKDMKAQEKITGVAKATVTGALRFTPKVQIK